MRAWSISLACLLVASVLVAFPPSQAQSLPSPVVSLELGPFDSQPLRPDVGELRLPVNWQYNPQNAAMAATDWSTSQIMIHWEPKCEMNNLTVTGPATTVVEVPPSQTSASGTETFVVKAGRHSPGLQLLKCQVAAYADGAQAEPRSNKVTLIFQVVVAFVGQVELQAPFRIAEASPGKAIAYDLQVVSVSNAQAWLKFNISAADGWSVQAPAPTLIQPGEQKQVTVIVRSPPGQLWTNEQLPFKVQVQPVAAVDESQMGTASSVDLVAQARGVTLASPSGFAALLVLVGIAGAVLYAKRKRGGKDEQSPQV